MKKTKKIQFILLAALIVASIIPVTAFSAADFEITSIKLLPDTVSTGGGTVNIEITIKNNGTEPITQITYEYYLPSGTKQFWHLDTINVGASKTYTEVVTFGAGDVNTDIQAEVWGWGGLWVTHSKTIKVTGEENVIRSGSEIVPEKDIYYVGETVSVTDTMRNSLSADVTNLTMEYYLRRSGSDTAGDTVTLGTMAGGARVENRLEYTFTEDDLGALRIGSKLTYYVYGNGPYTEYNVAHDFAVEPAPTPTQSPTPTETPEATPTPTDEPTASPLPSEAVDGSAGDTVVSAQPETDGTVATDDKPQDSGSFASVLNDRTILITIIIAAGSIVALVIVLLIILTAKKK